MNTNIWTKKFLAIIGSALMGLMLATVAYAAVQTVTAEVEFANPVSFGTVTALKFGILDVGLLDTESITIGTDDLPSGDTGRIIGGTQAAADLTVTAEASQTISIQVSNISNNTGYTLGSFTCNYNSDADTACQASAYTQTSVASATLWVGATLTGTGTAIPGPFNGSFDVTIAYQ